MKSLFTSSKTTLAVLTITFSLAPSLKAAVPVAVPAPEENTQVGKGRAVESYDPKTGVLQLVQVAINRLGIIAAKPKAGAVGLLIPAKALVKIEDESFVFIQFDERKFKRVRVRTEKAGVELAVLAGITPGQSIVIEGAALLRVVELDMAAGEGAEE